MPLHTRRPAALVTAAALAATGLALSAPAANAVSPDIVISEVYGGGGNSGATLKNDFIELYNRGTATVDVSTWSVQYASSSGSSWQRTDLVGQIPPGSYYLVREAQGSGGTTELPPPDATGSIAMSASSGKVALVTDQTALPCGTDCDGAANVRDFVGYGSANDYEDNEVAGTTAAPGLFNTTSAQRAGNGTVDTDDNGADFSAGEPMPQNCGEECAPPPPPPPATATIPQIQGAAHRSPLEGQQVADVPGIVTAEDEGNGFWFQDPTGDSDEATSDGLFVFTRFTGVEVGDEVLVDGMVVEFRPGGSSGSNLTITELSNAFVEIVSSGKALPPPTVVGLGGRIPPTEIIEDDSSGDVEQSNTFDPAEDGIDFYESLEGMLVQVNDAVAVGPTSRFGEIAVLSDQGAYASVRSARGGIVIRPDDFNPERVILDDGLIPFGSMPAVDVRDTFADPLVGPLHYSFGNFKLLVTSPPTAVDGGLTRESTQAQERNELAVASFNVENLDPSDPQEQFDALARQIVENLAAPDILTIEEIQDNDGSNNTAIVDADQTWRRLVDAIVTAGGPPYDWRDIDPADDQDGGEPGGNIRVGFLFRTDVGSLKFVDRPGGDATTPVAIEEVGSSGKAQLSISPGRIDPNNPSFEDSRKPLAGEFTFRGRTVFVVANHWNSKGGDDPLFGRFQPPVQNSRDQRNGQAAAVAGFVNDLLGVQSDAPLVVGGDLNDFEFSPPVQQLVDEGLTDLPRTLPRDERYTFIFDGNSQVLDHILLSPALAGTTYEYDIVHTNAEFADQASDHDPQVVRLPIRARGKGTTATGPNTTTGPYVLPVADGVTVTSLLTVGDEGAADNGYELVGIPDGIGAQAGRGGKAVAYVNHELRADQGIERRHGERGAFVSELVIDPATGTVERGSDLLDPMVGFYDYEKPRRQRYGARAGAPNGAAPGTHTQAYQRFCSGALTQPGQLWNAETGRGARSRFYFAGEEIGVEGRVFGVNRFGQAIQLPKLGLQSWENALVAHNSSDRTVVMGNDDADPGTVTVYVGTKRRFGTWANQAGLTGGRNHAVKVPGITTDAAFRAANDKGEPVRFGLQDIRWYQSGAAQEAEGLNEKVMQFNRVEDGAFDPNNPNDYYFLTTDGGEGTGAGGGGGLWRIRFDDIERPKAGGTLTLVLDGTDDITLQKPDNMDIDRYGNMLIQEDPGSDEVLARIVAYRIADGATGVVAEFDPERFSPGGSQFLTTDEESSGIVDAEDALGERGAFLFDAQVHSPVGLPPGTDEDTVEEYVENGQFLRLDVADFDQVYGSANG
jgi:predicted extracellular nuclease